MTDDKYIVENEENRHNPDPYIIDHVVPDAERCREDAARTICIIEAGTGHLDTDIGEDEPTDIKQPKKKPHHNDGQVRKQYSSGPGFDRIFQEDLKQIQKMGFIM